MNLGRSIALSTVIMVLLLSASVLLAQGDNDIPQAIGSCTQLWVYNSDHRFGEITFNVINDELQVLDRINRQLIILETPGELVQPARIINLSIENDQLHLFNAYLTTDDRLITLMVDPDLPSGSGFPGGWLSSYSLDGQGIRRVALYENEQFTTCSAQIKSPMSILTPQNEVIACTIDYTIGQATYTLSLFDRDLDRTILQSDTQNKPENWALMVDYPWLYLTLGDDGYFYLHDEQFSGGQFRAFDESLYGLSHGGMAAGFGWTIDSEGNIYFAGIERTVMIPPEHYEYLKITPTYELEWVYTMPYPRIYPSPHVYFDAVGENHLLVGYRENIENGYRYIFQDCVFSGVDDN